MNNTHLLTLRCVLFMHVQLMALEIRFFLGSFSCAPVLQQYDEELLSAAVKKYFLSHAASWFNLPNVDLRAHADDPPFPIAALQSSQQSLPLQVPTKDMLWDRKPVTSSFSVESKKRKLVLYTASNDSGKRLTITTEVARDTLEKCQR